LRTEALTSEVADFCVRAGYRGLDEAALEEIARTQPGHEAVARFAIRYREHLQDESILDYPELVLAAARLLRDEEDINSAVHKRFTHVLVDDAQELAPAQLQLLAHLNLDHLV